VEGEKITLMKWGNVIITKIEKEGGHVTLHGKIDVEDKDFKGTKRITWIAADKMTTIEVRLVEFDFLISKKKLEEDEHAKDFLNPVSKVEQVAIAEGALRNVKKGEIIQLERRGYFYVDQVSFGNKEIRLHFIPDGKTTRMSKISHMLDAKEQSKGKGEGQAFANKAEAKKAAASKA